MNAIDPEIDTARAVLEQAWQLTCPRLRSLVDQLAEPLRVVAGYHFGWCDATGRPAAANPGKGVRGALAIASALAVGGVETDALPAAVATELIHNFSLLHDDIMDEDTQRRGRPSAWAVFGRAQAILAGDALLTLAFAAAGEGRDTSARRSITTELTTALVDVVNGQSADLAYEGRMDIGPEQWRTMATGKTAALFGLACSLGGGAVTADPARVRALRTFGRHLGLAFQLVDDVAGLVGDADRLGKPVGGDIVRRKKSAPVVRVLHSDPELAAVLSSVYTRAAAPSPDEAAELVDSIVRSGAVDWALAEADRYRAAALAELDAVSIDSRARGGLETMADLAVRWDRLPRLERGHPVGG
ncbi:polyprenyl synthetase family protein [Nocardia sp. NBC_01503]|uniref:polyprenyl synthetase family protein n=1 Tax=Nocardia sp. NBC_01503 TaxID=2975997 RepID=UPI002E7C2741|nr:polyprenyl synthetase family protein [Nocardia sp. NBC_01503]WTL34894.1 polyprenyl synthetase family protein [Nocardia sp. NBC_01503]